MKIFDVTYTVTHRRPFKAPSEEWLRKFCTDNHIDLIECHEVFDDEIEYYVDE